MPCHESNDYAEFNKFIIDQKSLMQQLNNTSFFALETQNVAVQNIMNEAKKYGIKAQYLSWKNFVSNIDSFVNQPIIIHQKDIESNEIVSTWFAHNTKVLQGMMVLNFDTRNQSNNYTAYTDKYSLPLRYRAFFKYVSSKVSRLNDLSIFKAPVIQNSTQPVAPKYLIVDDVPTNCMILSKLLANHGYLCDIAYNGVEAVTMATKTYYPVIFMDINMPQMDGWDASLAIRNTEIELRRRSTIIAITANALEQDKQKCFDSGMDFYFSKPFDFKKLIDLLQAIEEETKAKIAN
jgi:CheY-like chemotaxis protein